ncbi:hypothetical protein L2E82_03597 [Cichorium intybus]|uniref:Uncharacterized protein n=1 Tax=Cichorium intybus TaxID=13427 RepID=A0ACB9H4R9_CICIN|nr:hypothetical protein L2E82_03597 [Cichorium intybus]
MEKKKLNEIVQVEIEDRSFEVGVVEYEDEPWFPFVFENEKEPYESESDAKSGFDGISDDENGNDSIDEDNEHFMDEHNNEGKLIEDMEYEDGEIRPDDDGDNPTSPSPPAVGDPVGADDLIAGESLKPVAGGDPNSSAGTLDSERLRDCFEKGEYEPTLGNPVRGNVNVNGIFGTVRGDVDISTQEMLFGLDTVITTTQSEPTNVPLNLAQLGCFGPFPSVVSTPLAVNSSPLTGDEPTMCRTSVKRKRCHRSSSGEKFSPIKLFPDLAPDREYSPRNIQSSSCTAKFSNQVNTTANRITPNCPVPDPTIAVIPRSVPSLAGNEIDATAVVGAIIGFDIQPDNPVLVEVLSGNGEQAGHR